MVCIHEVDASNGWHRVRLEMPMGTSHTGEWTSYQGIATLKFQNRLFFAMTGYWTGAFPVNVVLECTAVDDAHQHKLIIKNKT